MLDGLFYLDTMDKFTKKLDRLATRVMETSTDPVAAQMFTELHHEAEYIEQTATDRQQHIIETVAASQMLRFNCANLIRKIRRNRNG